MAVLVCITLYGARDAPFPQWQDVTFNQMLRAIEMFVSLVFFSCMYIIVTHTYVIAVISMYCCCFVILCNLYFKSSLSGFHDDR